MISIFVGSWTYTIEVKGKPIPHLVQFFPEGFMTTVSDVGGMKICIRSDFEVFEDYYETVMRSSEVIIVDDRTSKGKPLVEMGLSKQVGRIEQCKYRFLNEDSLEILTESERLVTMTRVK